jgi:SH3 domain protein
VVPIIHSNGDFVMNVLSRSFAACIVALLLVFSASLCAVAQTLYVKPSSEITLRRGQGTDFKIMAVVRDGTAVELLSEENDWAQVRLPEGKEGWVLRRYLSEMPPLGEQLAQLEQEKAALTRTSEALQQRLDETLAEKDRIDREYQLCLAEHSDISDKYLTLQEDTADVIQTKENLKQAQTQLVDLQAQLSAVRQKNEGLAKSQTLKWFLAGGGVLFLGWVIGLFSGRSRKKRSSLL